jgi:hypothetical protein
VRCFSTFFLSHKAYFSSQVPLDYTTNKTNATAAVALIRLPSPLAKDDKNYRGPVLFNPGILTLNGVHRPPDLERTGGPGESGVNWVVQLGESFQQILGNQFDVVGFDPR